MDNNPPPVVPTNEQIIDELTKDLKSSCTTRSNITSRRAEDDSENEKESVSNESWATGMEKDDESESGRNQTPSDSIDEEALKDREVTLSEDEKQKLRTDSEALKNEGNDFFRASNYSRAEVSYTEALRKCPLAFSEDRAILYANRAAAKLKHMDDKLPAIADCTKAVELNPKYLKAYLRRAQLYEEDNKLDNALADFKKILELDPSHSEANHAARRLPPLIEEANEKLKTEMLGKLKDLGNLVLKPFGLSTNNFELQQDPNSGGYTVKFNQNTS